MSDKIGSDKCGSESESFCAKYIEPSMELICCKPFDIVCTSGLYTKYYDFDDPDQPVM